MKSTAWYSDPALRGVSGEQRSSDLLPQPRLASGLLAVDAGPAYLGGPPVDVAGGPAADTGSQLHHEERPSRRTHRPVPEVCVTVPLYLTTTGNSLGLERARRRPVFLGDAKLKARLWTGRGGLTVPSCGPQGTERQVNGMRARVTEVDRA